jgi:hypothetical protein
LSWCVRRAKELITSVLPTWCCPGKNASTFRNSRSEFANPRSDNERQIKAMIDGYNTSTSQAAKLEQELFKQKRRLADAEHTLQSKTTKKAQEDQRIATNKIDQIRERLSNLKRTEPAPDDARIFPMVYAPVIVMQAGRRIVVPMRYQCRPKGKPKTIQLRREGLTAWVSSRHADSWPLK